MIRKVSLLTIIVIGIACLAIVAIGRHRRANHSSAPATATTTDDVIATVEVGNNDAITTGNDSNIDIGPDMLIDAARAPKAPSFAEGDWINSEALSLKKLRGRVVLVEFWTFACYNCKNTLPSVEAWDTKYRERGLTIVGVHTPETQDEYSIYYVRREVPRLGIKYPVVTDNEYQTWKAYNVAAWPTIFVIDKQGRIRWLHVGEGRYEETENVIKTLLAE